MVPAHGIPPLLSVGSGLYTHASSVGEWEDLSNRAVRHGSGYRSGEEAEAAEVSLGSAGLVLDHALERLAHV
jgi:hypothetical protein